MTPTTHVAVDPTGLDHTPQADAARTGYEGAQRRALHRLRRAQGQLAAVIRAVEDGKPCRDVVTQLAATSKALDRAGVALISNAMQDCLSGSTDRQGAGRLTPAELEKLFMMFA